MDNVYTTGSGKPQCYLRLRKIEEWMDNIEKIIENY